MTEQTTPDPPMPSSVDEHGLWQSTPAPTNAADPPDPEAAFPETSLGPFEIHEVLGRGGMSVVLAGTHRKHQVPVAVKVITSDASDDPRRRTRLRDEVQAASALTHPGVVMVFDYGELQEPARGLTDRELEAGTPYYVMERTHKGTLLDLVGRVTWEQAESILLTILDALAHAHAAGVVHRDIKPVNILLSQWGGRVIPKVADFGIAYAMQGGSATSKSVGTPRYMAPEQIEQPWRRHGPWSDLYSLGCVAHELVSGDQLFDGNDLDEIYRQHLVAEQPTVDPVIPVPDSFQDWLDRMLARNPDDRFQSAADAARALKRLPSHDVPEVPPPGAPKYDHGQLTPVLDPVLDADADGATSSDRTEDDGQSHLERLPERWPEKLTHQKSIRFIGAGLGLYGLRSPPLIGREFELDHLWQAFRNVQRRDEDRCMMVRGSQGSGKTRLVEWFTERLDELGAATILHATHSAEDESNDGLSGMLGRHFRTLGASDTETEKIVRNEMGDYAEDAPFEWQTMTQIVRPSLASDTLQSLGIQIAQPSQRYAVVYRYLQHLAEDRPVVVWCDDAQWANDTLEFLEFVRNRRDEESCPILFVVNVTEEELADRSDDGEAIEALTEAERTEELELEPLEPAHHERLVQELLHLEGDLAREVVRRTNGNPLFAVELIGDWVHRGVLEVGERGFVLRDGVEPTIPDHLHDVWSKRIESLLADCDDDARFALELAAALGIHVQTEEWEKVCELADVRFDTSLIGELAERRLADRTDDGWRFAHAMLRESVERLARDEDRWTDHCRLCATMVESLYEASTPLAAERYGRYAMSAEEYDRALEPLFEAATGRRRRGEYREAQQLLSDYLECLEAMGVGERDPRRGKAWVTRARTYLNDRQPREAEEWAHKALEAAREHEWNGIRAQAMGWQGLAAQWLGDEHAAEYLRRAYELVVEDPSDRRMRGAYGSIAHGLTRLGDFEKAERLLDLDLEEAEEYGDERRIANNQYLRCRNAFFQDKWEEALDYAESARELFEAAGHLPGVGGCQEFRAEIYRRLGEPERAADTYRSCIELLDAIGSPKAIAQTNLATIRVKDGDPEEAEKLFVKASDFFEASGRKMFQMVTTAGLMACASERGWWGNIDEHLDELEDFLASCDQATRDLADLLEFAGDRLKEAERYAYAARVLELARRQWEQLDNTERLRAVERKIANCK